MFINFIKESVNYYDEILAYNKALKLSKIFKGIENRSQPLVYEKMRLLGKEFTTIRIKYGKKIQKLTESKLCEILEQWDKENKKIKERITTALEAFIKLKDFERS